MNSVKLLRSASGSLVAASVSAKLEISVPALVM
jgi:hypothetical protein